MAEKDLTIFDFKITDDEYMKITGGIYQIDTYLIQVTDPEYRYTHIIKLLLLRGLVKEAQAFSKYITDPDRRYWLFYEDKVTVS